MRMRARGRATAFIAILLGVISSEASATMSDWDLGLRTGISLGTMTVENPELGAETYIIGGIPVGLDVYHDLSPSLTVMGEISLMFDVVNNQTLRQGYDGGILYHLIGGSRHHITRTPGAIITNRAPYSFSWVLRGGSATYAAASATSSASISGTVLELRSGFDFCREVAEANAIRFSLLANLIALPSSTSRLRPQMYEFTIGWQRTLDFIDP